MTKEERLGQAIADALETRARGVGWMKAATAAAAAQGVSQPAVEKVTRHVPELIHNPGAEDGRFWVYVDSPADDSIYTLEAGELTQYPKLVAGGWDDAPATVDWARGVEPDWVPYLRYIERMLQGATVPA